VANFDGELLGEMSDEAYGEALFLRLDPEKLRQAKEKELACIRRHEVFEFVDEAEAKKGKRDSGAQTIGSRWVCDVKGGDGAVRARLVA
jgi:hypothetical protein